jgi:tRNA dimethylallyltransferase
LQNQKLIAILGPTASGKTSLAIELALRLNGEIISGDSMLVFKKLDIGTAKPTIAEMRGVKHHLIDICEPEDNYSVAQFQLQAQELIVKLNQTGKIPILCGGTGLYAKALLEDYDFSSDGSNAAIRERLNTVLEKQGIAELQRELLTLNQDAINYIDMENPRRIIRAIETILAAGELPSKINHGLSYDAVVLGIDYPREQLYKRINARVDSMVATGLFAEVDALLKSGLNPACQALKGIGYKEVVDYLLSNLISRIDTIEKIKTNTRHFAKRQLTWYKKMPYIHWLTADSIIETSAFYNDLAQSITTKFYCANIPEDK